MTLMDNNILSPSPPSSQPILPQKRSSNQCDTPEYMNYKKQATNKSKIQSNYTQACLLLHAIEINRRQMLHPRCIAHLANFVARAWETNPNEIKTQQLYQLMQNLLSTTAIKQTTLENALITFCKNKASTPTPCSSVTLLIAISYIEKLKKKYGTIKGTVGCGSRLITIAYLIAAKFLHSNLKLIIHVPTSPPPSPPTSPILFTDSINSSTSLPLSINSINNNNNNNNNNNINAKTTITTNATTNNKNNNNDKTVEPFTNLTPPSPSPSPSPLPTPLPTPSNDNNNTDNNNIPMALSNNNLLNISTSTTSTTSSSTSTTSFNSTLNDYHLRILRLEMEFLYFLDYDLSLPDPAKLVRWANTFDATNELIDECTSADEGDDEMDDEIDTCSLN
ncbi:hypothetical protein BJ944DRAFT_269098 [Cunninghamella echinulata]|nr:hypothetical protein BJ944DRAFT_269098 [Cunninghamella echinulata]